MTRVHLVRHGESTWNREGRVQGQAAHPPLTERGRAQAEAAAEVVAARVVGPVDVVWSSDLVRAVQTAEAVADRLGASVRTDPALREQALGDLEGRRSAELVAEPTPSGLHVSEVRWGGGESVADVHARLTAFMSALPASDERDIVVVTHGDALRVTLAVLDGRGHRDVSWDEPVPNGGVVSRSWAG